MGSSFGKLRMLTTGGECEVQLVHKGGFASHNEL